MKTVFASLLCGLAVCAAVSSVQGQELTQTRKTPTFAPGMLTAPVSPATQVNVRQNIQKRLPKYAKTTILRFETGQLTLSEVQKELLLRISNRLSERKGGTITVVAASTNSEDASLWARLVENFLRSYEPQFIYIVRYIKPENVVGSINNTVKIIEQR
ncbi:MAG: hypothetical protein ACI4QM_00205 [Alphaproteobacteria bacterium]